MHPISVQQARAIDHDATTRLGMPSILLMENAARAVAEHAATLGERFIIYCGPGNNGGDGLAAARHLGSAAQCYLLAEPDPARSPDAALQLAILRNAGVEVRVGDLPPPDTPDTPDTPAPVLIDALFGTGLSRPLTGTAADWVHHFNASPGHKLAVDIPSGLHGDTGEVLGVACRVAVTVTFVAPKHGLLAPSAVEYVGELRVVGLGLPQPRPEPRPEP